MIHRMLHKAARLAGKASWALMVAPALFLGTAPVSQAAAEEIEDITGKYHFLSPQDTLALLEEEDKLKGWLDVFQQEEESDTVLSYEVTRGWRKKDHVEFKTSKIHQKYYRFSGTVQRGTGRKEGDADYLRLVGELEIVSSKGQNAEETVEKKAVVLKSMSKAEGEE